MNNSIYEEDLNNTFTNEINEYQDITTSATNNKSDEIFNFDEEINKSIKEIYIRDKKIKNEKKIKNILGIKVDYDILKNNPKKIRNYLLLENSKKWDKA